MKKITAFIVLACFLLTLLPLPQMAMAASPKEVPAGISISIDDEGETKITIDEDNQNSETLEWLKNIKKVIVDDVEFDTHGYNNFTVDEDKYTIELNKPILKKKVNTFKILATGYKTLERDEKNEDFPGISSLFQITGIEEKTLGDKLKTAQALVIKMEYGVDDNVFNSAFKSELKEISIDGKVYPKRASDGMLFLTPFSRTLQIYDQYEEGRSALENFRKHEKHEVIVSFNDGTKLEYRDDGYKKDDKEDKEDKEEDKKEDKNKGKMAEGLELGTFVKNTPGLNMKGVKLYSDIDESEWYSKYYLNMRYVVIDDKEVIDMRTSAGRSDVKLDNGYLAIATYTKFYESGEAHRVRVYFDDKSYVDATTPGYKEPPNAVDPFANESHSNEKASDKFILEDLQYEEKYGVETLQFKFKNIKDVVGKISDLMPKAKVIINGQTFSGDDVSVSKWMEKVEINTEGAIAALKSSTTANVKIIWPDGTESSFTKEFPEWMTLNKKHSLKDIVIEQTEKTNLLRLDVDKYNQSIKSLVENKGIVINGKVFDKSKFTFGLNGIESTDKEVWSALISKKPATIQIKWNDKTTSEITKEIAVKEEKPASHKSLKDEATGVQVDYKSDAFDVTPSLQVKAMDSSDAISKEFPKSEALCKKYKNISAYQFKFLKADDAVQPTSSNTEKNSTILKPKKDVTFKLPLGAHDKTNLKVYFCQNKNDFSEVHVDKIEQDMIEVVAKDCPGEGCYIIGSGKKQEEPTYTGKYADLFKIKSIEKSAYGDGIKFTLENSSEILKKYRELMLKAFRGASYRINGVEIKNIDKDHIQTFYDGVEISDEKVSKAFKKKDKYSITIKFPDGSSWNNGVEEEPSDEDKPVDKDSYELSEKMPNGDYTLSYKMTKTDGSGESTIRNYLGKYARLHVEGDKKTITFLNKTMASSLLDFAIRSGDSYQQAKKEKYDNDQNQQTFEITVDKLDEKHLGAVLISVMGGKESDIGDYSKYKTFNIEFVAPVVKGWHGFEGKVDKDKAKKENDDLLTLKLLNQGVKDTDGNGKLSPDELKNATGKLDLSGENLGATSDVSMLKDLGPNVTELYISANGIKSLPEGFFDNMTGLRTIYLGGNKLTKLPKNVFDKNKNLRELSISSNPLGALDEKIFEDLRGLRVLDLSGMGLQAIPANLLKNNNKLKELYLYENELKSIPDKLLEGKSQLNRLHVNSCKLENIPTSIGDCKQLKIFWAYNNAIKEIPDSFTKLQNLSSLDLTNNYISKVPKDFWKRMAMNARKVDSVESKLLISNNLLTDIPFKEMADNGGSYFRNVNVSLNLLKPDLTDEDIEGLKAAGVSFTDMIRNAYQPQKTIMASRVSAKDGNIKLTQDMDIVETAIWISTNGLYDIPFFKNKAEYRKYLEELKKQFNIRTANDARAAAEIFDKQGYEWKIKTVIQKNDKKGNTTTVYDKYSSNSIKGNNQEFNTIDGKEFNFTDKGMKKGDSYTLQKTIYVKKGTMPFQNLVSYRTNFEAGSNAGDKPEVDTPERVPFKVMHETKDQKSQASDAFHLVADVSKNNGKYEVVLTAKPMDFSGARGHIEKLFVYDNLEAMQKGDKSKRHEAEVLSTYEEKGVKYPEKLKFILNEKPNVIGVAAQVDAMNHGEAAFRLVFGEGEKPDVPNPSDKETGVWEVPISVLQANKDVTSAANGAFGEKAIVRKTENGYQYKFETPKFVGMNGQETWLTDLHVYRDADAQSIKDEIDIDFLIDKTNRWTSVAFELAEKANMIPVTLQAEGMPFAVDARIQLDWSKAVAKNDSEPEKKDVSELINELNKTIVLAKDTLNNGTLYTEDSTKALRKAIDDAQKALKSDDEKQLKKMIGELKKALKELKKESDINKGTLMKALNDAIDDAQSKLNSKEKYTAESVLKLEKALEKAKTAQKNGSKKEIQTALQALNKAITGLEEAAVENDEYRNLVKSINKLIKKAEDKLDGDKTYTKISRRKLRAAIVRAQDAIEDKEIKGMEEALDELEFRYANLRLITKEEEKEEREEKESKKEKKYSVNVSMKHATKNKKSMADESIRHRAEVVEKNGKATYTVYFKPMKRGDVVGEIEALTVDGSKAKAVAGKGDYESGYRFTRNKLREEEIDITVKISALGGMEQDARLVFDWSTKKLIKDKEDEQEDEQDEKDKEKDKEDKEKDNKQGKVDLKKAYIQGYPDNTFRPDNNVTRAEAAVILANFISENSKNSRNMLNDVSKNAWYYDAVQKLVDKKVLSGYPDGGFHPNDSLSRAELAALITRAKGMDTGKHSFKDVSDNHWASKAIGACAEAGYISGYPDGSFAPDRQITRAEMVSMVNRSFKIPNKKTENNTFRDVSVSYWGYKDIMKAANN